MSGRIPEQPRAVGVQFKGDRLIVQLEDGRELGVPLEWFPQLRDATGRSRARFRLIGGGVGIHWIDLDEDVSVRALLAPSNVGPPSTSKARGAPAEPLGRHAGQ